MAGLQNDVNFNVVPISSAGKFVNFDFSKKPDSIRMKVHWEAVNEYNIERTLDDVDKLLESTPSSTIELETIEKMIDEFYESEENLKIPVLGVYCYSIKKLAGYKPDELKSYKDKLINFCNSDLEK
jgi:hypothetical protein